LNLKEFRDQLLGKRAVPPIVVTWGMRDGGRLGIDDDSDSECKFKFLII
jgi:hypothetical protein